MTHAGGCLCGGVRFTITGPLAAIQICHCSDCRRAQGGPFATNIPIEASAFKLDQGHDLLTEFESSIGKFRVFCRRCGGPIYSRRTANPDVLRVRAGTIDEPLETAIGSHIYASSKASWWAIDDALPKYEAGIPPASGTG